MTTSLQIAVLGPADLLPRLVDLALSVPASVRVLGPDDAVLRKCLALGAAEATELPPSAAFPAELAGQSGIGTLLVTKSDDVPAGWGASLEVTTVETLREAAANAPSAEEPTALVFTGELPEARTPGLKDIMAAKKVGIPTLGTAVSDTEDAEDGAAASDSTADIAAAGATAQASRAKAPETAESPRRDTEDALAGEATSGGAATADQHSARTLSGPRERVTAPSSALTPAGPLRKEPVPSQEPARDPRTAERTGTPVRGSRAARATGWLVFCIVTVLIAVVAAKLLRGLAPVQDFIETYPGEAPRPESMPVGLPGWLGWQHFLNAFFLVLIISTGVRIRRETRPPATWTSRRTGKKISLTVWLHQCLDLFWLLNGVVFVVLLFATGQWLRLIPTDISVLPHALSAGLQYLSLDWPESNGWFGYNALQQLTYFVTVFVAAPLAALSGWRMSTVFPKSLERALPMSAARQIHFPVMLYFVVFVVVHVGLVLATGMKRNLNHIFAATDAGGWIGFLTFVLALLVMVVGWSLARPAFVAPVARAFGDVSSR